MTIERLEVYLVRMPLVKPWITAFASLDAIESVFVKMTTDKGSGWGETTPLPNYSPEWPGAAYLTIRDVIGPLVLGRDVHDSAQLQTLLSGVKGNPFAKAAIDIAWWDIKAKSEDQPLWKLIGGVNQTVTTGTAFGAAESIGALVEKVVRAKAAGFKRVKLKFGEGWDLDVLEAVRKEVPDLPIHIDCNASYTLDDLPVLTQLDQFDLAMIEQPLPYDDLVDHAELQRRISTPICLDESVSSPTKARKAIELQACGWINIKSGRTGGITAAVEVHDICRRAGMPCWIGGMLESSLGAHVNLALATLPNVQYPNDLAESSFFFHEDLSVPDMRLSGPSEMRAPDKPGIGAEPDPKRLRKLTLESEVLE